MRIVTKRLGEIRFNDWNPNEMSAKKWKALKAGIESEGYVQPALVREIDDGTERFDPIVEVIDGEHRLRAMLELFGPDHEVELVVTDVDEIRAKMQTLAMNRIRGDHVPLKEALVLADLLKTHTVRDLEVRLGMPREEVEDIVALLGEDAPSIPVDTEPTVEISIFLYRSQFSVYTEALDRAIALMPKDESIPLLGHQVSAYDRAMKKALRQLTAANRARALEMICANFLATPDESLG